MHYDNQKVALLLLDQGASPHAAAKVPVTDHPPTHPTPSQVSHYVVHVAPAAVPQTPSSHRSSFVFCRSSLIPDCLTLPPGGAEYNRPILQIRAGYYFRLAYFLQFVFVTPLAASLCKMAAF